MEKEANLNLSKKLYRIQLYLIKVIPMVMAFCCLLNSILGYFDIDLAIFSYIGSVSILGIIFMLLASFTFRFCFYHRMFIYYLLITWIINIVDLYIGIPINDLYYLTLQLIIAGICLFIILYLYLYGKRHL